MTKLRSYFLCFCFMHRANLNCRCDCSTITSECRRYFNSRSIFRRNDFVLFRFLKKERRAPTIPEKEIYFRFYPYILGL